MVTIKKGDCLLVVPQGAFHNYYEPQGYVIVGSQVEKEELTDDNSNTPDEVPEVYTQEQLMSMTTDQLYEIADMLGLDYQKVRTKNDLIKLIIHKI